MGFCCHSLGDTDAVHPTTLRGADQRASSRKLQPLVPKRRLPEVPPAAGCLPQRNIRPDGGVLETKRRRQATVRRDTSFPTAQKFRIHACPYTGIAELILLALK